ncbi:MAG: hypothetical protein JXX29_00915 [Deltaproteobacteria bacterium]|nr:hypothetical protein [Deltaproteobacteria bacterium]MBN2670199.1 hypothetical protein [Deltaproteobacteria bacterium]
MRLKILKTGLLTLLTFVGLNCGGAPADTATTPENETGEPTTVSSNEDETVIVENRQLEVALEEQLRSRYEEMSLPTAFIDKLVAARVELVIPDSFDGALPIGNDVWEYDYGLVSKSGKVDVRIKVLPGEITEKNAQGNVISVTNELMTTMIRLNGANLVADIQDHPATEASSRFNATKYTTGTFQPIPAFSDKPIASAGIFYKEGYGRVIVVALLNNLEDGETRTEWITGANAMRFADEPGEESAD